jgi:hypothetical protein
MMKGVMGLLLIIIIVQGFYSLSITLIAYNFNSIGEPAKSYAEKYGISASNTNELQSISDKLESALTRQSSIPLIEVGALVFYSGNIILDLLANFAFAIPQMIGMITNGLSSLLSMDTNLWLPVQLFFSIIIVAVYLIGILQLVTGIRSGQGIV